MWISIVMLVIYILIFSFVGWLLWKLFSMLGKIVTTLQQILVELQRK